MREYLGSRIVGEISNPPATRQPTSSRLATPLFLAALILAAVAITLMSPIMGDFYFSFRVAAERWLEGTSNLYDIKGVEFYNAPWLLGLVIPLVYLRLDVAQVLFTVLTLASLFTAIMAIGRRFPPYVVTLSILNQPFLNMVGNGEIDTLPLLGAPMGYIAIQRKLPVLLSVSFFVMAIKPNNLLLVMLLYLWMSKDWRALLLPQIATLACASFIGIDWPLRLFKNLRANPPPLQPQTTIWHSGLPIFPLLVIAGVAIIGFAYIASQEELNLKTLSLGLSTGLAFAPYALSAHYVLLIPAFLFVASRSRLLAALAYCISWALVVAKPDQSWFAASYPLVLWGFIWLICLGDLRLPSPSKRTYQ